MSSLKRRDRGGEPLFVSHRSSGPPPLWLGLIATASGVIPVGIAVGIIPAQPGSVHAPMAVIGAIGMAFVLAGLSFVARALGMPVGHPVVALLGAGCGLAFLGSIGWLVLFDPRMPDLFRWVFGGFIGLFVLLFILSKIPGSGVRVVREDEAAALTKRKRLR